MEDKHYFRLYACCILTKGYSRSIICDTQRGDIQFIPNELYDILTQYRFMSIQEVKQIYDDQYSDTIDEYFDFLFSKEFIFYCSKPELDLFPDISFAWDEPAIITNAVVDIGFNTEYNYKSIFDQLESLGCKHIQLRFYVHKHTDHYQSILQSLQRRRILSVEFLVPFSESLDTSTLERFINSYPRIHNFIIHSSPYDKIIRITPTDTGMGNLIYVKQNIKNDTHCGVISPDYFSINIKTFTESQQHNTCLNRKIAIDMNGEIKNCPSMIKSYGNIKDITLQQALDKPGFKDVWYIHKDQVNVCKHCEFRHICTDCRAYLQDPTDLYAKPAKCSYDPYTATWGAENQTNNLLHGR